jgi:hypothetical protein
MDFIVYVILFVLMFIMFPLGIVWLVNARYTKGVKGKYMEGALSQDQTFRICTKASYVVNGTTYIWDAPENAPAEERVYVPLNAVVGQTEIDLYYDPKNPSSANSSRDVEYWWGIAFIVIGSLLWLLVGGWLLYDKWTEIQKEAVEAAKLN